MSLLWLSVVSALSTSGISAKMLSLFGCARLAGLAQHFSGLVSIAAQHPVPMTLFLLLRMPRRAARLFHLQPRGHLHQQRRCAAAILVTPRATSVLPMLSQLHASQLNVRRPNAALSVHLLQCIEQACKSSVRPFRIFPLSWNAGMSFFHPLPFFVCACVLLNTLLPQKTYLAVCGFPFSWDVRCSFVSRKPDAHC